MMKTFAQFLIACSISSSSLAADLKEFYYGDSIAVGYGGDSPGSRRVGASPAEVLSNLERDLKNDPGKFKGQTVNISTGVSNNPGDFRSIEKQLKLLQQSGANVKVLGAAQGRYDKENERLAALSTQYGANFKGGFKPGRDGVHPASYASYDSTATLSAQPKPSSTLKPSSTPKPKPVVVAPPKPIVKQTIQDKGGKGGSVSTNTAYKTKLGGVKATSTRGETGTQVIRANLGSVKSGVKDQKVAGTLGGQKGTIEIKGGKKTFIATKPTPKPK